MRTALIFHGPQGAGKNLFFETVMQIYGEYGRIVDQSAIEDKFNDWASRKLFLIADEVVARAELYHVKNKLKGIVTGEWIRINPKNVAAHDERNHVNLVFLSNERQPLVLDKDDRRYAVIWTPEKLPEGFYADVKAELDEGGIAALHYHLRNLDLGDFNEHTKPPMTQAKADLIEESADSIDVFVDEWIAGEIEIKGEPLPFIPCLGTHLYTHYSVWARERGFNNIRNQKKLIGHLAKIPGWSAGKSINTKKSFSDPTRVNRKMVIPSEEAMQKAAINRREEAFTPPPEGGKLAWITDCYFKFAQAIGVDA
jgi:putative DNA primase/helicase